MNQLVDRLSMAPFVDIPSVLAGYAASQPDQTALLAPGRLPLSYAALHAQQEYVRAVLSGWGLNRGDTVAVVLPEGPELAMAAIVLPVSATIVPLGLDLSVDGYERLFHRCSVRALISLSGQRHAARAAADRSGLFQIDLVANPDAPAGSFDLVAVNAGKKQEGARLLGADIACILSTSGTTSEPKLIPSTHDQFLSYATAMKAWYRLEPDDLNLHFMPTHFCHGLTISLLIPLLNGASVVCLSGYEAGTFFSALDEYRPTWLTGAFIFYRDILRHVDDYKEIVRNTRLRFIRSGAGRLEPNEIEQLEQSFRAPLIVSLSASEAFSITHNPLPPRKRKSTSVGRPVGGEVKICDENGQFLDAGVEGEIVTRGALVFQGYLDDPVATKGAFLNGWYCTGDLGKFDKEGFLYLTGRIKEVINCGGVKISPAEIDRILEMHPAVESGAAFAIPHPTLGELAVAAVIPVASMDADEHDIQQHVRSHLGTGKAPHKIFFVKNLPRTELGKIQRNRLREAITQT